MTRNLCGLLVLTVLAACPVAEAQAAKPPRVLLIGDSICIYYAPFVKELLAGKAVVVQGGHAGGTRDGLRGLSKTLAQSGDRWDVIHFNWGLHDVKDHCVVPIAEYEKNLRELVKQLKATGAKLVWATTTPVGAHRGGNAGDRQDKDVVAYNAVALAVIRENGIPVDDLYAAAKPTLADIQKPDEVHFTDDGSKLLAKSVAESILKAGGAGGE